MTEPGELGRGNRLRGEAASELVRAGYAAESAHGPRLAADLSAADLAHAVMLVEAGAVGGAVASALLGGLLELHAIPGDSFPWDPSAGDAFSAREAELRRRVGPAAAGWLSAGRPRRESLRVALRLLARDETVSLAGAQLDLADALVVHGEAGATDLATDYTYLQPAQPSTVGHLMLAYAYPALRDAGRLQRVHEGLGRSVAGAGGSAGSRWPLDRARLAELLGLDAVAAHTRDATWQTDCYVELASAVAIGATHQSQLAQDLEILASQEFGVAELADRHCRASALMPQKRNPYALAVIRTQAGIAAGDLAAMLVALHTGSARTDHFHLLNGAVPRLMEEAVAVARLTADVVAGLRLDAERWGGAGRRGGAAAADVADVLAMETGLDYRTAHGVVGRAIRDLAEAGRPLDALTPERLADAARAVDAGEIAIGPEQLAEALDPAAAALGRPQEGGSAPEQVEAMVAACRSEIAAGRTWATEQEKRAAAATNALVTRAEELAGI